MAKKDRAFAERLEALVREEFNSSRGDAKRRADLVGILLAMSALVGMAMTRPGGERPAMEALQNLFYDFLLTLAPWPAEEPAPPPKTAH